MLKGQKGVTHVKSELLEVSLTSLPACSTCLITSKALPPVQAQDEDTVTFETKDLVAAIAETLKREVDRTVLMKLTGRVD